MDTPNPPMIVGGPPRISLRSEMWQWFVRGTGAAFGFVLVVAITAAMLRSVGVVLLVAVAILLATGLEPAIGALRLRTGLGRGPTILIVYAAFFVVFAGLILLIVPSAARQLGDLSKRLPTLLDNIQAWAKTLGPPLREGIVELVQTIRSALNASNISPEPTDLVAAGVAAADAVISAIAVLSLIFFWLTGHQRIQRFTLSLLPAGSRRGLREAWNEVETRLGLWVRGQLILMGTIFVFTTIAYFVLGLEGALFLGLVAAIAEAIPIVGPALGAVPALVVAAASGRIELVILVALVYVVIQVIEGNVLVPLVMRSTIGVPPFIVLISLLIGAALDGVVGAFLAVPFTAALIVILERAQARDNPVALESSTSGDPGEAGRDDAERASPDSRASNPV